MGCDKNWKCNESTEIITYLLSTSLPSKTFYLRVNFLSWRVYHRNVAADREDGEERGR